MTRKLCSLVGGLLLVTGAWAQQPLNEEAINDAAARAIFWGDFADLERQHQAQRQPPGQLTEDGRHPSDAYMQGLTRVFSGRNGAPGAYYTELDALTLQWVNQHPRSELAHALCLRALSAHAWHLRGGGYASTVSPQGWKGFSEVMGRALDWAATHREVLLQGDLGERYLMDIGVTQDWTMDQLWAVAQVGLAQQPNAAHLYLPMLQRLLPRWGGDARKIDRYILDVTERTRATQGLQLYARLYAVA